MFKDREAELLSAVVYLDLLGEEKGVDAKSAFNSVRWLICFPFLMTHYLTAGHNPEPDRPDRPRSFWIRRRHCRFLESAHSRIGSDGAHAIHDVHYVREAYNQFHRR